MERPNILIIMTDEHDPAVTGCYGHPVVQTPNLDRLSRKGVLFENAYCNSPMCVPSRMSFLTGRYGSEVGVFDNGSPLASEVPTFAHYFEAAGYDTTLCGRMHMVGPDRLHGFGRRLYDDMTAWQGYNQKPNRKKEARRGSNSHVTECGPGKSRWLDYDSTVTDLSERFLRNQVREPSVKPWLFVSSLMNPHFPLCPPQEYFDMYPLNQMILPDCGDETFETQHPVIQHLRYFFHNNEPLPEEVTRTALASYYAVITLTDSYIGRLLDVIDNSHLQENTIVIYLSDHGEMAGQHGIWQKQCFYESSVRVPIIIRTPWGVQGVRVAENVSLVDIMPSILDMAGIEMSTGLRGESLKGFVEGHKGTDHVIFSEYHAQGMLNAGYMVKKGHYKYNYYVGHRPQLFDLRTDPGEFMDLACDESLTTVREDFHRELLGILDPVEVDKGVKENQQKEGLERAYGAFSSQQ